MVTERPAIRTAGVTQATRASPSTSTVQQPHWPWGAHAVLDRRDPQPLAQHRQEGFTVGDVELDGLAVERERESGQLNDWPQPQVRSAFGLLMWNPEPWRPSR